VSSRPKLAPCQAFDHAARTAASATAATRSSRGGFALNEAVCALPLARRIVVDALLASSGDPDALVYRVTPRGFYLAPRRTPGRVHDYRYDEESQTFYVFDRLGDPVALIVLKD